MPRRNPATDIAPLIAVRAAASHTPTAPPAPVARFFDEEPLPAEVWTRAAEVAQTHRPGVPVWQGPLQEAPAVAWLRAACTPRVGAATAHGPGMAPGAAMMSTTNIDARPDDALERAAKAIDAEAEKRRARGVAIATGPRSGHWEALGNTAAMVAYERAAAIVRAAKGQG